MTDQEINEAVARKLGWKQRVDRLWERKVYEPDEGLHENLPDYARSIEAAWEIVEQKVKTMRFNLGWIESHGDTGEAAWSCRFWSYDFKIDEYVRANTAPRAICEAFLKLP